MVSGLVVQVSAPLPGLDPIARVIEFVADVTVLPPASWMATTGWADQAVPIVPPPGWVVNPSLDAVPTVMLNVLLIALVRPVAVAVRV